MTRVVLDPNVLVSALLSRQGAPAMIVRRCLEGDLELVASGDLLAELERALSYPKIRDRVSPDEAEEYVRIVRRAAQFVDEVDDPPRRTEDPGDDYLVALAAAAQAALVSGDRHLLDLAGEFPVFSPREFLRQLS